MQADHNVDFFEIKALNLLRTAPKTESSFEYVLSNGPILRIPQKFDLPGNTKTNYLYFGCVMFGISSNMRIFLCREPIFCFIIYFVIGLWYSQKKTFGLIKLLGALLVEFFVLSVFESYFLMNGSLSSSGLKPSSVLFSIAAVIFLYSTEIREKLNLKKWIFPFAFLGCYSFGIYLTHLYFLIIFSKFLPATFLPNISKELYWGGNNDSFTS